MRREIKFRAWNIITKQMIDLKKITPLALNMDTDGLFIPFSGMPLMQYTGLKDKNGVEIYEGDIVEYYVILVKIYPPYKSEVKYINGMFLVANDSESTPLGFTKCEVIGNIHANPDLIAGVKA